MFAAEIGSFDAPPRPLPIPASCAPPVALSGFIVGVVPAVELSLDGARPNRCGVVFVVLLFAAVVGVCQDVGGCCTDGVESTAATTPAAGVSTVWRDTG